MSHRRTMRCFIFSVILSVLSTGVPQVWADTNRVLTTSEQAASAFTLYTRLYPQETPAAGPSPHLPWEFPVDKQEVWSKRVERPSDHASIDVAFIEFEDNGSSKNPEQLQTALALIDEARESPNGAVVVVFTHGWFHGKDWSDSHFASFRQILMHLAVREEERAGAKRRVVGIYLGWKGGTGLVHQIPLLNLSTFGNRLRAAEHIGLGGAFQRAISRIVESTKRPTLDDRMNPLVVVGHSMGALMTEVALLQLLRDDGFPEVYIVGGDRAGQRILFPDLFLLLNSAADSKIAEAIRAELRKRPVAPHRRKTPYQAPLFISATSEADWATKYAYRLGKWGRVTDGNSDALVTHQLMREPNGAYCPPKPGTDFGQPWHCLREPSIKPDNKRMNSVAIDLPQRNDPRSHCHLRYHLAARLQHYEVDPFWFFKMPIDISAGHNDIFNERGSLLTMALMQVSGAIMSLSENYEENFEGKGEAECPLPKLP
ncbi:MULTISPECIES: hypothetical protein [unclassified Bradyrhizobium]|uniref:hypothetical protein n=1 Tax=unclassified Bradyrhizobium TaxID=2631580 RepID=UPI002FEEBFC3